MVEPHKRSLKGTRLFCTVLASANPFLMCLKTRVTSQLGQIKQIRSKTFRETTPTHWKSRVTPLASYFRITPWFTLHPPLLHTTTTGPSLETDPSLGPWPDSIVAFIRLTQMPTRRLLPPDKGNGQSRTSWASSHFSKPLRNLRSKWKNDATRLKRKTTNSNDALIHCFRDFDTPPCLPSFIPRAPSPTRLCCEDNRQHQPS